MSTYEVDRRVESIISDIWENVKNEVDPKCQIKLEENSIKDEFNYDLKLDEIYQNNDDFLSNTHNLINQKQFKINETVDNLFESVVDKAAVMHETKCENLVKCTNDEIKGSDSFKMKNNENLKKAFEILKCNLNNTKDKLIKSKNNYHTKVKKRVIRGWRNENMTIKKENEQKIEMAHKFKKECTIKYFIKKWRIYIKNERILEEKRKEEENQILKNIKNIEIAVRFHQCFLLNKVLKNWKGIIELSKIDKCQKQIQKLLKTKIKQKLNEIKNKKHIIAKEINHHNTENKCKNKIIQKKITASIIKTKSENHVNDKSNEKSITNKKEAIAKEKHSELVLTRKITDKMSLLARMHRKRQLIKNGFSAWQNYYERIKEANLMATSKYNLKLHKMTILSFKLNYIPEIWTRIKNDISNYVTTKQKRQFKLIKKVFYEWHDLTYAMKIRKTKLKYNAISIMRQLIEIKLKNENKAKNHLYKYLIKNNYDTWKMNTTERINKRLLGEENKALEIRKTIIKNQLQRLIQNWLILIKHQKRQRELEHEKALDIKRAKDWIEEYRKNKPL